VIYLVTSLETAEANQKKKTVVLNEAHRTNLEVTRRNAKLFSFKLTLECRNIHLITFALLSCIRPRATKPISSEIWVSGAGKIKNHCTDEQKP